MSCINTWTVFVCPTCGSKNWINDGDINDLTAYETEAIECHECHIAFWRDKEDALLMHGEDAKPEEYAEIGRRK